MSMRIWDPHFLRYAGAEPARQMRKDQHKAQNAYVSGLTYEKPLDSPDRPSNRDRMFLESMDTKLSEVDNPSKIEASFGAFRPPVPEGSELTVVKDSPDNPSHILASLSESAPPAEPPAPLSAGDIPKSPADVQVDAPATGNAAPLDMPAALRPSPAAPEADTGLMVSETA